MKERGSRVNFHSGLMGLNALAINPSPPFLGRFDSASRLFPASSFHPLFPSNPASAILIRTFSKREFEERTESFSKFRLQARWIITKRSSENKFQMIREFLIILPRGRKLSFRSEKVKLRVIVALWMLVSHLCVRSNTRQYFFQLKRKKEFTFVCHVVSGDRG